jgi:FKBP-type peptidyl-prolyl cis-trans isomerase
MKMLCLFLALTGALLLGGCGSSDEGSTVAHRTTRQSETTTAHQTRERHAGPTAAEWTGAATTKSPAGGGWAQLNRDAGTEADELLFPAGPPPGEVVVNELRAGTGPEIEPEDWFTIDYVALTYNSGWVEQDAWGGAGFEWVYGPGKATEALVIGMEGMRQGGLRELIAPSYLAYGSGALVYLVRLREVKKEV